MKPVLKDEIQRMRELSGINENIIPDNDSFITYIQNVKHQGIKESYNIPKQIDIEINPKNFNVFWSIKFEKSGFGITNIIIDIHKITGEIFWVCRDQEYLNNEEILNLLKIGGKNTDKQTIAGKFEINTGKQKDIFLIDQSNFNFKNNSCYPNELELDFYDFKIKIT